MALSCARQFFIKQIKLEVLLTCAVLEKLHLESISPAYSVE